MKTRFAFSCDIVYPVCVAWTCYNRLNDARREILSQRSNLDIDVPPQYHDISNEFPLSRHVQELYHLG